LPDRRDAESAWKQAIKGKPGFLVVTCTYQQEGHYQQKGRPKKDAPPDSTVWHVQSSFSVDQQEVEMQIKKDACFILATNVLDEEKLSNSQVYLTYKEQGGVERGFRFLKDPLFLASSVFVKKGDAGDGPQFHHGSVLVSLSFS
jgi:transposase